ncbi:AraC family transcriptional regulator [Eubacteriales bacterium OttesenSCG-928-A19]|nr:AraC family transcriptional regulator [Eubacteriales bacterium OttesenSCG-928-A19]
MEAGHYKHSFKVPQRLVTSLSVYNTGLQRCDADYAWGPGVRDHYLIHCVTAGKGTYTVKGHTYSLKEGDLFFAWPNEMITYRADTEDPWSYCWIGFAGLDAVTLLKQTDFTQESPVLHISSPDHPRGLLLDIYDSRGGRPHEIVQMTAKLFAFLSWLMETARHESRRRRQAGQEHVERACEFIAGNYASPITIADIASNVGVCRSLLNRAFQQHLEISPVQYLTRYRMAQACALLKRTDLSIKAVAFSVGYEDPLYFSRRFRELMNCSPREYAEGDWDGIPYFSLGKEK